MRRKGGAQEEGALDRCKPEYRYRSVICFSYPDFGGRRSENSLYVIDVEAYAAHDRISKKHFELYDFKWTPTKMWKAILLYVCVVGKLESETQRMGPCWLNSAWYGRAPGDGTAGVIPCFHTDLYHHAKRISSN